MNILLIESYYTGSHKQWIDGFKKFSKHNVRILYMKGQFWKWRMHGGAVTLAKKFNKMKWKPDMILCTDMLDLTTFIALTRNKTKNIPIALYFHENQLSYPWSETDRDIHNKRDNHYSFINYVSALAADKVFFNSYFHMKSFLKNLKPFLKNFPDYNEIKTIDNIHKKSKVLYLGLDLKKFDKYKIQKLQYPIILWNHRWEYDKNPDLFFKILSIIKNNKYKFKLVVLGENFSKSPMIFKNAKETFKQEIIHWGYAHSFEVYAKWIWKANILPVTSIQEFFGISIMEAIYCNTYPILPNRLSYPELIPQKYQKMILYKDNNDLYKKIIWAIENFSKIKLSKLKVISKKYDWKFMAPIYDRNISSF